MVALNDLLAKIKKGPAHIGNDAEGGGVLALALHCLMVKDGYQPTPLNRQNPIAPASEWNSKYKDEWVFEYTRKGYESIFVLHCSLQAATGKMFVQGREQDSSTNMHNLGLQVGKYVPDVTKCKSSDWRGVLESEDVLDEMFLEYIAEPLRKQAVPSSTQVASLFASAQAWVQQTKDALNQRDAFVPLGIGVSIAVVAAFAVYAYRRQAPSA